MRLSVPRNTLNYLALIIFSASLYSAPSLGDNPKSGFRALSGQSASTFQLPADTQLFSRTGFAAKANGRSVHYRQFSNGAEVLGGQLTTADDLSGNVRYVIGSHYPNLMSTNDIKLNKATAKAVAVARIGGAGKWKSKLMINPRNGRFFYHVENLKSDSRWVHWIDAEDGTVVNAYDSLTTGSGIGVDGDNKDLTGLTTLNDKGSFVMISADGRQSTYDAKNRNRLPGTLASDGDDIWDNPGSNSPGHGAIVDAQFYAKVTDDYLIGTHGFDWISHYSQGMVSSAHLKRNYNNAYWNGSQMAYGDGDGVTFIELSGDLDVVGHELTHGVTEATSDLIYQNESGALNEAFSDMMGAAIEFHHGEGNWTIGEDITVNDNGIRNMADPNEDGDPSHYDARYTGTADNGGVHSNSGIANHWFYLMVEGGQNANLLYATGTDVTPIGLFAAEQVAFLGFTALPATATFCNARESTVTVAASETEATNVADAWDEVGVTETLCANNGGGGGGTGSGPVISDVSSKKIKGVKFKISWTTDIPANTVVTFTCCGTYTKSELVTGHSYNFNGQKNYNYEYYVSSTDVDGITTIDGPYYHQN